MLNEPCHFCTYHNHILKTFSGQISSHPFTQSQYSMSSDGEIQEASGMCLKIKLAVYVNNT